MGSTRTWRALTLGLLVLLIATVARSTFAMPVTRQGTTFKKVKVVTETAANTISSNQAYTVDLPGATTSIGVPEGVESLILVRFSAESACYGRISGWCSVRIFVGSEEAGPKVGDSYAFLNHRRHAWRSCGQPADIPGNAFRRQLDRRQRVLDLMSQTPRHFSPCAGLLSAYDFGQIFDYKDEGKIRGWKSIHITDDPPYVGAIGFRLDDWTLTVERIDV